MPPDDDEPKVKTLLGPTTEADLAHWFSLPSYQQLEDQPATTNPADDPEMQAVIGRRSKALAAVDPELVEAIHTRTDDNPRQLIRFAATIDVRIDDSFGLVDHALIAKASSLAEPRERERPDDLADALSECAPQALLRDLHRPELDVVKQFEVIDVAADQRFDIVAEIADVMATPWKLPAIPAPLEESRCLLAEVRADRRRPWTDYLPSLPNRRVRE